METFDNLMRYGSISLLFWLAVLICRDFRCHVRGKLGVALALSQIVYLVSTKVDPIIGGFSFGAMLIPLCFPGTAFAWLFCLSQFDDHFNMKRWHWGVVAAQFATGFVTMVGLIGGQGEITSVGFATSKLITLATLIHLVLIIWQGRQDDLMESRCVFRRMFVTAVVVLSVAILVAETFLVDRGFDELLLVVQSSAFFIITFFVLWRISGPDGIDLFVFSDPAVSEPPTVVPVEDKHDLDALRRVITDKAFLEQGLTIAGLADQLRMPEHRLRRLINQQLGFRNFSDFLNHHRVSVAQERLADCAERHVPVLTIAMDLGYGSLGPFNRAFKERTGQTPSEYRRQFLSDLEMAS
ncbi:helix-turn-helix domain-containing protein [Kordiimonas sp.]|uniref:AraC family transcriptional regulator n=1 Tax=Kordiimonas sp. TaxID=1970157 RepID=UPI003A8EED8B